MEWSDLGRDIHELVLECAFGLEKTEGGELKFIMVGEVGEWWAKVWADEEKAWQTLRSVNRNFKNSCDRIFPFNRSNAMLRSCAGGHLQSLVMLLKMPEINPSKPHFIRISAALGYEELVRVLMSDPRVDPSSENNSVIQSASWYGHYGAVKALLQDPRVDPTRYSLHFACKVGNLELVKLLLEDPRSLPSSNQNQAFRNACKFGHALVVEELLKDERIDPSAKNNISIQDAAQNGFFEVVDLLLKDKRVSPEANNNFAIQVSCTKGHEKVVELLLKDPRVDPSSRSDLALRRASFNGYTSIVELLLTDKRVNPNKAVGLFSCSTTPQVSIKV
eukprot:TRINITY_DN5129_c0_g1_i1.p1 TRINITY_DN5129_c0_g1~~TRINITY_DN5129_c0_g1_i1.p1  ORF type:complete len:367 (+),score=80.15 TRINITY_DN5129_c0_g1_i1:103-1101(+)